MLADLASSSVSACLRLAKIKVNKLRGRRKKKHNQPREMDNIGLLAVCINVNNTEDSKKRGRGIIVLQPCL